ncbi:hypothetical protein PO909_006014 [Leuciscus waleckii]
MHLRCVSDDNTQPPSPTSSTQDSESFGPASTGSPQSLGSPFVYSTLLRGSALGLPVVSSALARGSHHSTSARRPVSFTLAPPSFGSIWDCRPYGSTGLPHPSGSNLVSCRSACTMDFWAFWLHFVPPPFWLFWAPPSLQLQLGPQSHRLRLSPLASWLHLGRSSLQFRLGLQIHQCCLFSSALHLRLDLYIHRLRLSLPSTCQVSIMAPPSLDSAFGLRPGCALGPHLAVPALVSSLDPPTVTWFLLPSFPPASYLVPAPRPPPKPPSLPPFLLSWALIGARTLGELLLRSQSV